MRIYIAGPMRRYPLLNFPAFDAARDALKTQGHEVVSPADEDRKDGFDPARDGEDGWKKLGWTEEQVLTRDKQLLDTCDAIILLPGWIRSRGVVRHELPHAQKIGLKFFTWEPESERLVPLV